VDDPTVNEVISQLAVQARWTLTSRGAAFAAAPTTGAVAKQQQAQAMSAATVSKQEAGVGVGTPPSQSAVLGCAMFTTPGGHPATIPWRTINVASGLSARFHFGGRSALVMGHHMGQIRLDEEDDAAVTGGGSGLAGEAGEQAAPSLLSGARSRWLYVPLSELPANTVLFLAAVEGNGDGVRIMERLAALWGEKRPGSPPIVMRRVTYEALLAAWHAAGPVR
jgi:hypothetical protein